MKIIGRTNPPYSKPIWEEKDGTYTTCGRCNRLLSVTHGPVCADCREARRRAKQLRRKERRPRPTLPGLRADQAPPTRYYANPHSTQQTGSQALRKAPASESPELPLGGRARDRHATRVAFPSKRGRRGEYTE